MWGNQEYATSVKKDKDIFISYSYFIYSLAKRIVKPVQQNES